MTRMTTHLIFLGTCGSGITKSRACAGILVEGDKLIDVGFGVLNNLFKIEKDLDEIETVYITHTHSDHIGDFTGLIWAMALRGRTKPLNIIGSRRTCTSLKKILELQSTPKIGFLKFEMIFTTPYENRVPCKRTIHDPENLAYKLDVGGQCLVYTGDTAKSEDVSKFASGADILIHDATFLSSQKALAKLTKHSTAEEAGEIAEEADARELVLTHFSPLSKEADRQAYLIEAQRAFSGKVTLARDLLKMKI